MKVHIIVRDDAGDPRVAIYTGDHHVAIEPHHGDRLVLVDVAGYTAPVVEQREHHRDGASSCLVVRCRATRTEVAP